MRIDRIKFAAAMARADLNGLQLAEKAGVSRGTITAVRTGKSCSKETADILDGWISAIQNDPDYNEVTDRKTWERWREITSRLDTIRTRCESRMATKVNDWSSEIFHPEAYNPAVIEQIVQRLRRGTKRPNRRNKGA